MSIESVVLYEDPNTATLLRHEYDERARHRVVSGTAEGVWTPYTGIAELELDGFVYRATTDYFGEELFVATACERVEDEPVHIHDEPRR